jgi:hypothetical protein
MAAASKSQTGYLIGALLLLGMGSLFFWSVWADWEAKANLRDLKANGQTVDGRITNSVTELQANKDLHYWTTFSYSYKVNGREYTGRDARVRNYLAYESNRVKPGWHDPYAVGQPLSVLYHPAKPSFHRTAGITAEELSFSWGDNLLPVMLGLFSTALGMVFAYSAWRPEGEHQPGVPPTVAEAGDYVGTLERRYQSPSGRMSYWKESVLLGLMFGTFSGTGMGWAIGESVRKPRGWEAIATLLIGGVFVGAVAGEVATRKALKAWIGLPTTAKEAAVGRGAVVGAIAIGIGLGIHTVLYEWFGRWGGGDPSNFGGPICGTICGVVAGAIGGLIGGIVLTVTRPTGASGDNDSGTWFLFVDELDSQNGMLTVSVLREQLKLSIGDLDVIKKKRT